MKNKGKFEKEIEADERRMDEIYNQVLGYCIIQEDLEVSEKKCIVV